MINPGNIILNPERAALSARVTLKTSCTSLMMSEWLWMPVSSLWYHWLTNKSRKHYITSSSWRGRGFLNIKTCWNIKLLMNDMSHVTMSDKPLNIQNRKLFQIKSLCFPPTINIHTGRSSGPRPEHLEQSRPTTGTRMPSSTLCLWDTRTEADQHCRFIEIQDYRWYYVVFILRVLYVSFYTPDSPSVTK